MTVGQKIKKLRSEKGLTQKELADKVHVTFQTVSKWENDENEPDISTLRELSKLFGCSLDELLSEDDSKEKEAEVVEEEKPTEPVTKTIIIHQKEMHVCAKCKKDIPEGDIEIDHVCVRPAGRGSSAIYRDDYYHKECFKIVQQERTIAKERARAAKAKRSKKLSFGWGIAGGVVALVVSLLVLLLVPECKAQVQIWQAILYSILAGYGIFAMLYCIISGSYIGDVFVWCAGLSIKFPGIIFSWDLGGFAFLIVMKVFFAICGFLIGVLALLLAIVVSAALGAVSFPFVLIHNIRTDYEDGF